MPEQIVYPRIFHSSGQGFSERDAFEIQMKGWVSVKAEFESGSSYTLTFFEPGRLGQELDDGIKLGEPCFAELNLIVIPEVTLDAVRASVEFLTQKGFFDDLKPQ